jgi:hypothetical protein
VVAFVLAAGVAPPAVKAQADDGTAARTIGGAALGGASGAVLGLLGSLEICTRTLLGSRCPASATAVGGSFGVVAGGLLGHRSETALHDRLENAGYGAAIGAVLGVGLRAAVRQLQWGDAAAFAVVGGAIGAAPRGTLIGVAVGAAGGGALGVIRNRPVLPDAFMLMLVGGAIGGLADWAQGATDAAGRAPPLTSTFSIAVR